jgi:hypothetical protein
MPDFIGDLRDCVFLGSPENLSRFAQQRTFSPAQRTFIIDEPLPKP